MPSRNEIGRPLLLAGILALGTEIVWVFFIGMCNQTADRLMSGPERVSKGLLIRMDGTPVIQTTVVDDMGWDYAEMKFQTLDGKAISIPEPQQWLQGTRLSGRQWQKSRLRFRGIPWQERVVRFADARRPDADWYLVHDGKFNGTACFVGYDPRTRLRVGYLGRSGFRRDQPPQNERFRIDGRTVCGLGTSLRFRNRSSSSDPLVQQIPPWTVPVLTDEGLLVVDLKKRAVRVLVASRGVLSAGVLERAVQPAGSSDRQTLPHTREYFVVRTADRVVVVDPDSGKRQTLAIPTGMRDLPFTFCQTRDEDVRMIHVEHFDNMQGISEHRIVWFDSTGKIAREEEVVVQKQQPQSPRNRSCGAALMIPVPAVVVSCTFFFGPRNQLDQGIETDYRSAFARSLPWWGPMLLITSVLGAVAAWCCWWWQKRYAMGWSWVWIVFVFLLGVPGLLGYLFHRRWPVRAECAECRQSVPRDREACCACGSEFPPPAEKGIEVFA